MLFVPAGMPSQAFLCAALPAAWQASVRSLSSDGNSNYKLKHDFRILLVHCHCYVIGPQVAEKVKKFFMFYAINRHKTTVLTPSYHAVREPRNSFCVDGVLLWHFLDG